MSRREPQAGIAKVHLVDPFRDRHDRPLDDLVLHGTRILAVFREPTSTRCVVWPPYLSRRCASATIKPRQTYVSFHVAGAITARGVVEQSQFVAYPDNRGQADAFVRPRAIPAIEHNGLVLRVPPVWIFAPVNPNGIGVLSMINSDVIGKEEPGLVATARRDLLSGQCRAYAERRAFRLFEWLR
jgi:hypothetical protein